VIPFNKPYLTGNEIVNLQSAHSNGQLAGDGHFTKICERDLESLLGSSRVLLTHSCTAALEMAAILADIRPGDEVIMPSYTFVSTANAFALRGAIPVFVDIRKDTLNIDEMLIEEAITDRTRAVVPVHYAGVGCEMDKISDIASRHNLLVIEDAAQGICATYKERALGSIGDIGTLSFHETKNIISGEGGALAINSNQLIKRAEIIREKGTDRSAFFRGDVDKYTWRDIGSSYVPGEIIAAFLEAQLKYSHEITNKRLELWNAYHSAFRSLEVEGLIRRPIVPKECLHNAHLYYLLLPDAGKRSDFIHQMKEFNILCPFHYVPLHSSPFGEKAGRIHDSLSTTEDLSQRIVRLPLWIGMEGAVQETVISRAIQVIKSL